MPADAAASPIHDAANSLTHVAATSLIQGDNCTFISAKIKTGDIAFTGVDVQQLYTDLSNSTDNISLADFQDGWKNVAAAVSSRADRQMVYDMIPALEYP